MNDIWIYDFEFHKELKNNILKSISDSDYQSFDCSGDLIYKTDYFFCTSNLQLNNLENRDYFWKFDSKAESFYDVFRKKYCVKEARITNFWFQQYEFLNTHGWHFHGDSNISCVYYLELPDNKFCTEFYDVEAKCIYSPKVSEGNIIVFPSHIPHRSPVLDSKNRKTILSWNMSFDSVDVNLF